MKTTRHILKGGRLSAFENNTQRKCNNIVKKYHPGDRHLTIHRTMAIGLLGNELSD